MNRQAATSPRKSRPGLPIAAYFLLAQAVVVVASIVKVKAVTLMFGAQGIALYGILANLTQIGSHLSAFGMHSSGVRSVARARDDSTELQETVGLYFLATAVFTTFATVCVPMLAWWGGLFDGLGVAARIVCPALGLAIFFAAIATAQGTVFKGVGATRIVVLRNIAMPLAGVLFGTLTLFSVGLLGVTSFFIFQPLAGAIISIVVWRRVTGARSQLPCWPSAARVRAVVKPMLLGGSVFLVSSLIVETTILFGRWSLQHFNSIDELAFLNASWMLVMMSYGFMQGVMSTWFYPVMAHAAHRGDTNVSRGVDTVVFLTSVLGAAFVMAVAPFAPLILRLFYSDEFIAATPVFDLALIGLMAQLVASPILYLLLSRGHDRVYLFYHLVVGTIFAGLIWMTKASKALEIMSFFVIANWIGVMMLVVGLHLTGQFSTRPRTLLIGGASLTAAAASAHFGQSAFVQSAIFPAIPIVLLMLTFPIMRDASADKRKRAASADGLS